MSSTPESAAGSLTGNDTAVTMLPVSLNAKVAALQQVIQCLKNAAGAGLNAGFCKGFMPARAGEHGCVGLTTDLTAGPRGTGHGHPLFLRPPLPPRPTPFPLAVGP